jgi:phosphatidylserine/phosphatidylglycerophosphate/cardiolipin synthase-like enzyme
VDGCWAYVGSANFDPLSLRRNHELGLALHAGPVLAELEDRLFLPDMDPAWELTGPLPLAPADRLAAVLAGIWL